jgi:hypothetical protein
LLRIAQDPNATELEQNSAKRKLGALAREGVISKEEKLASDEELTSSVAKSQAEIEGAKAGAKTTSKGAAARQEGFIDSGIEAADSVNNIKRSIELLESIKTGGFDNAALKVKQFFGVEGADEGELSARLGVSILAQLKPIFGSAFTEREGARLDRISARFGASPETNKRLLEDALSIAERSARRGLAAAKKSGDTFSAEEIQTVLDSFQSISEITELPPQVTATDDPQNVTGQFSEGQTATGANGQKAIFTNGQWVVQ